MKSILGKLVLLFFGILIPLLLFEFGLRLVTPEFLLIHPPGLYTSDPDVGYVLTPNFKATFRQPEFETDISINQDGLRGAALRPLENDSVRILILGDSQAWGFGVEDDETNAAVLEKHLRHRYPDVDIQVLNAGVPGYGTYDQLNLLKSRLDEWQPDLVIVEFFSVNDLKENLEPANTWAMIVDGMLASRNSSDEDNKVITWDSVQQNLKQNSILARLTFDTVGYLLTSTGLLGDVKILWGENFSTEEAQLAIDLLVQIAETSREAGADVLFLYTTGQGQVLAESYIRPDSAMVVETAAARANMPWEDASFYLNQHPNKTEMFFAQNGHWTVAGHQAIADLLEQTIISEGLISPGRTE